MNVLSPRYVPHGTSIEYIRYKQLCVHAKFLFVIFVKRFYVSKRPVLLYFGFIVLIFNV